MLTAPHLDGSRKITTSVGIADVGEEIVKLNYHLYQLLTYDDTGKSATVKSVEIFHIIMPSGPVGAERVSKHWLLPKRLACFRHPERIKLRPDSSNDVDDAAGANSMEHDVVSPPRRGCDTGDSGLNWARVIPMITLDPSGGCRLKPSVRGRLDRADSSGSVSSESSQQACSAVTSAAAGTTDVCTAQTNKCVAAEQTTPISIRPTTAHGHHIDQAPDQELKQRRQVIRETPGQRPAAASEMAASHDETQRSPKRQRVMEDSSTQSVLELDHKHPEQAPAAIKNEGPETAMDMSSEPLHERADLHIQSLMKVQRPMSPLPGRSLYVSSSTVRRLGTLPWRALGFSSELVRLAAFLIAGLPIAYSRPGVS